MRGKIKLAIDSNMGYPYAFVSLSKKRFEHAFIDVTLANKFKGDIKSIEFSDQPFEGAEERTIAMAQYDTKPTNGSVDGAYICQAWLKRMGLKVGDGIYFKMNR